MLGFRPQVGVRTVASVDPTDLTRDVVAYVRFDCAPLRADAFELTSVTAS